MALKVLFIILLCFLLLLVCLWIKAQRPPLPLTTILKGTIVFRRHAPAAGQWSSRNSKLVQADEFISGTKIFLIVTAKVGTPGQPLRLHFDFTWPYTWVIAENAEKNPFTENKIRFNSTQSSTFFPRMDGFFSWFCEGLLAEDRLSLGIASFPLPSIEQTIGMATHVWGDFLADGVIGFSPNPTSWKGDVTLVGNLFYSGRYFDREHQVATLWVNSSDALHDMNASLTLGGFDRNVCFDEGWIYSPVSTYMDWDTWVNAVRIEMPFDRDGTGGEGVVKVREAAAVPPIVIPLRGENRTMNARPMTHLTFGPKEQVEAIMHYTGCKWMGQDCKRAEKLRANVVFELEPMGGGVAPGRVVLTPRDYLIKIGKGCHCLFLKAETFPDMCWNFGVGVLQKYCVQMDYARQRIGFGLSKSY